MATVGFVGVGNMGGPMVRNLVKAGHRVQVFDRSETAMNFAVQAGARAAGSAREAAAGVGFAITMLPEGRHVREVMLEDGVIAGADAGTLLIDCSTIDIDTAQACHAAAAEAGFEMLDAPVSGGTIGADAGSLTFMCGGAASVFDKARPVLAAMGHNLVHCGGPGMGQAAKICNNMVAGINMLALSEAFTMGERLGLARDTLFDVISTSSGSSWVLTAACPVPGPVPTAASSNGYQPGFMAALMAKDLRLSQDAARLSGTGTPLGAAAAAAFALHCDNGHGALDSTSIVKLIQGSAAGE